MVSLDSDASEFDSTVSASAVASSISASDVASMSVPVEASISLEEPMSGRVRTDPGTPVPAL